MAQDTDPRVVAAGWLPERPGKRPPRDIPDAIVEPDWGGLRVAAALARDDASIFSRGEVVSAPEDLLRALLDAFRADEAVITGHLTVEAFRTGQGVVPSPPPVERPPILVPKAFRRSVRDDPFVLGRDRERVRDAGEAVVLAAVEEGVRHAFVATDLLLLDGEPLDDIPLLERKRLLETVIEPSDLVRLSPWVKPSAKVVLVSWGTLGFGTLSWRSVNSRHLAGRENPDWAMGRAPASPMPGPKPTAPR